MLRYGGHSYASRIWNIFSLRMLPQTNMESWKEAKKRRWKLLHLENNDKWTKCYSIFKNLALDMGDIDTGTDIWIKIVMENSNVLLYIAEFLVCNEDDEQDETGSGNVVYAYKFLEMVL